MDFNEIVECLNDWKNSDKAKVLQQMAAHFTCTICKEVLKNTVLLKECAHRYCHSCITTHLNTRKRSCPECDSKTNRLGWTFDYQYEHLKTQFFQMVSMEVPNVFIELTLIPWLKNAGEFDYQERINVRTKKSGLGV